MPVGSFSGGWWDRQTTTLQIAGQLRAIGELAGKAALYERQTPQVLESLRQIALVQSTESSNRIEGISIQDKRLQALMKDKIAPRDRSEAEIAGYRDVLRTIHASHSEMPVKPGVILQLHRDLYSRTDTQGGAWKPVDNVIVDVLPGGSRSVRFKPVFAFETPHAVEELCQGYQGMIGKAEPLLLIPTFILDFLCIHPFADGNGRMARLLTTLLLYEHRYSVARYISLEMLIERTKETYYDSLFRSSQGWHESAHDITDWWSYWLGVVLGAYRELESRAGVLTSRRGAKTAIIVDAISRFSGGFTVSDIQSVVPDAGIDLIRRVVRRLRDQGQIACSGRGRDARWHKTGTVSVN